MSRYRQITIVGCGLIGGSIALGAKKRHLTERIVGCDRPEVLERALQRAVIDSGDPDPAKACPGSEVVVLCTPVGAILDLIERLGPVLDPTTLITDVGSTKSQIVERAQAVFGDAAPQRFLAGHPMAGKEHGGLEHADDELFSGAKWLFTPLTENAAANCFAEFVRALGAEPVSMQADAHDELCAWISHLPQMISIALANSLSEFAASSGQTQSLDAIGGRALREMTRIASSPYSMWRDIALTNTENIEQALQAFEQRLAHIRENLRTPELREEFQKANRFKLPPR